MINTIKKFINKQSYSNTLKWGERLGKLVKVLHEKGENRKTIHNAIAAAFKINPEGKQVEEIANNFFIHLGKIITEILRFDQLEADWESQVKIQGFSYLEKYLQTQTGVILLSAHLGNWEYLISGLPLLGINDFYAIVWKQPETRINTLLDEQRKLWGTKLLYSQDIQTEQIIRILKKGGVVLLLGDRYEIGKTNVNFFGYRTGVAAGPFVFARETGAGLIPVYTYRKANQHHIIFEKSQDLEPLYYSEKSIKEYLQESIEMIEQWISLYPEQWMWIFKRGVWKP